MPEDADLSAVRAAAADYAAAGRALRREVRAAHKSKAKVAQLAQAAGVTRQTIYRWVETDGDLVNVRDALNDALQLLSGLPLSTPTAEQISRRIGHDEVPVLLLGIRMGLGNLPPGTPEGFTDDERAVLARATFVEEAARKHHDLSGEWPATVRVDHDLAR